MTFRIADANDPGLLAVIHELAEDGCLSAAEEHLARAALERGIDSLDTADRRRLENEVIAPYLNHCEDCGSMPDWDQVLMVYDTGLCADCFERLERSDGLALRPGWLAVNPTPADAEATPESAAPAALAQP